jgi:hypothetical protein
VPFTACHTHHQPNPPTTPHTQQPRTPPPTNKGATHRASHMQNSSGHTRLVMHTRHNYKEILMLASTIQISNNNPTPTNHQSTRTSPGRPGTKQPHPTTPPARPGPPPLTTSAGNPRTSHGTDAGLIPQNPNSVPPPTRPAGASHLGETPACPVCRVGRCR